MYWREEDWLCDSEDLGGLTRGRAGVEWYAWRYWRLNSSAEELGMRGVGCVLRAMRLEGKKQIFFSVNRAI